MQFGVSSNSPPSLMSNATPKPWEITLPDLLNTEKEIRFLVLILGQFLGSISSGGYTLKTFWHFEHLTNDPFFLTNLSSNINVE